MTDYGLAIHTSSASLGLAIANFAGDDRAQVWELGRETSNLLHQYLLEFLQPQSWQDLKFIAVAKGPGGFTGTRMGVVTARTLAQQLDLPLFAISTLAAVAWQTGKTETARTIAVQMPAQRGEVFGAIYTIHPAQSASYGLENLLLDAVMPLAQWQQTLGNWPTPYTLIETDGTIANSVTALLELAHLNWQQGQRPHWSEALPFYGQHPVA